MTAAIEMLQPVVPVLPEAAEPIVLPVPAGAAKVLPRWADEDEVLRWRLKYRVHELGEPDRTGVVGDFVDGKFWTELELRPFTRELPLTGMLHGQLHYFKVAIETPDGWSNWSHIVGSMPPSPQLPGKPAAVYATVKDDSTVLVRWTRPIDFAAAVSCGHIQRYKLLITWQALSPDEDEESCRREILIDDDADCCEVTDLQCLRAYRFQVAAENVTGWGELSDSSSTLSVPSPVPPQLPPPTLRRATHHSTVIQWQHPPLSDVPIDAFQFRYSSSGDFESNDVQIVSGVPSNISQYVVEALAPGTNYAFQVTTLNRYGMGIWSDSSFQMRTLDGREPSKVNGLCVPHIYNSFITLQWPPAEENGFKVTKHLLRFSYKPEMTEPIELPDITVVRKDGVDRTDLRHLRKLTYFFQVASINIKGMSEWSDPAQVDLVRIPRLEAA
jgi:hypothetical protein